MNKKMNFYGCLLSKQTIQRITQKKQKLYYKYILL